MKAAIASVHEMESEPFRIFLHDLESYSAEQGMDSAIRYCRRWEYPWIWLNGLEPTPRNQVTHVLDIGSAASPMPRWMRGEFLVHMVETDPFFTDCRIVRDERLPFHDNKFDWVTSFSVIEHQNDKGMAIDEVARVLKPGGCLGITFDLVEPSMGMHYPREETPMTLKSFEDQVWFHPAFGNTEKPHWNLEDIPEFLAWHSATHPNHTYIAGGAILKKI